MPLCPNRWLPLVLIVVLSACEGPSSQPAGAALDLPAGVLTPAQVQGRQPRSARVGDTVTVQGVVVGNFRRGLGGVFLQSERDDGDPDTAEGLFVSWPAKAPWRARVGDRLRVVGEVQELGELPDTLTSVAVSELTVLASGQALPKALVLAQAPADASAWERWEGMRLRIDGPVTATGNDGLQRYGELAVAFGGRLHFATEQQAPGPEAQAIAADNARRLFWIDDGSQRTAPDPLWYLPEPISAERPLRVGSELQGLVGVLDQRHGRYRLQLTEPLQQVRHAPRPAAPVVAGDVRVVSLNLLNLFNGDGRGGGFPTERGASDLAGYRRQQGKLVALVQALAPHLAALLEVENDGDGPESALAQFVVALNAAGPARDWQSVKAPAGDAEGPIRVALIYRRSHLRPIGAPAVLLAAPFGDGSRPPLAQTFQAIKGPRFTVVANHFKSKGSCEYAEAGDRDGGDGQGCWNATRVRSAQLLGDWLAGDPTASGSDLSMIVGDLNAYSQEDPVRALTERGWRSVFSKFGHSFVFGGMAGRLDHALLSPALFARLRGASDWHVNSDEPGHFSYQNALGGDASPWRSSDHDPLLLGLDLAE